MGGFFARDICVMLSMCIANNIIKAIGLVLLLLPFFAFAQDDTHERPLDNVELTSLSEIEVLRRARLIRRSDPQGSIQLSLQALKLSKDANNYRLMAQSHSLLGDLFENTNDLFQARNHFFQASLIYEKTEDKRNQIRSTIDYVDILFDEKNYKEGMRVVDDLLPIAEKNGEELLVASVLVAKGNGYQEQKDYEGALVEYIKSLDYLTNQDEVTQSRLASAYHEIAQCYKHLKNDDKSLYFYTNSLNVYTILQDQKSIAATLKNIADIERKRGNYVASLEFSLRGIEIQRKLNDTKSLAKALRGVGITYRQFGRYEKAIEYTNEAYLIYKDEGHIAETAETSNQLGLIYTSLKQFDQARSFYQLTIDFPEDKINIKTLASALREVAVIDLQEGNLESALAMAKRAHAIYQGKSYQIKSSQTARIIGKIYRQLSDDDKAIKYFREALKIAEGSDNENYQIKSLTQLGSILIGKDNDEAFFLLKRSLDLAIKNDIKSSQFYAYRFLRRVEKERGNILESLQFAEEEIKLSEILQKDREKNEISKAKAKLDSHKKEMELNNLKEKVKLGELELAQKSSEMEIVKQANRISELELTKNRYASIALTTLLVICLASALYIYKIFIASRKRNRELDYLAARDPLTNCYNRRFLSDLMNRDFSDLELLEEYSVIMADVDHFKVVNDNHGHNAGDSVLRGVANVLQKNIRQNDIAARYGGEEFCIVLPGAAIGQAARIAEAIRQKVEGMNFNNIKVTCSFGITSIRFDAKTPTELIGQADLALYQSKINGRNRVTLWDKAFAEIPE